MLLGPYIHYFLEFFLFLVLVFDTLGYIVTYKKGKSNSQDYSRLLFTWIFSNVLCSASCCLGFLPLSAEIFLLLKIYITLPVLGGSAVLKKKIVEENMLCQLVSQFTGGKTCEEAKEKKTD